MTEETKKTLIHFAKICGYVGIGIVALVTSIGVWEAVAVGTISSFYGWVAGVNLAVEGYGLYSVYHKFFPNGI